MPSGPAGYPSGMPESEQEEHLELKAEPGEDDPRPWLRTDPDRARERADDQRAAPATGPEQQAVHVEPEQR